MGVVYTMGADYAQFRVGTAGHWQGGGGVFVKGEKLDKPGYFFEFFRRYVRFVRSKACF